VGRIVTIRKRGERTTAFLDGTWWDITSNRGLDDGSEARVIGSEGIRLVVEEVPGDV
jgi:membrane protein implicated in regulation of membrane protease activity